MRPLIDNRTRTRRILGGRVRALAPAPVRVAAAPAGLGLTPDVLEELLLAVSDAEDFATTDVRARLGRGRAALEAELARTIEA